MTERSVAERDALATGNGLSDDHITYAWYSSANGYRTPIQVGGLLTLTT